MTVLLVCVATTCSASDREATGPAPRVVDAIEVSELQVWGDGRALSARATAAGEVVVLTTTGVHHLDTAGRSSVVTTFDGPVTDPSIAMSGDGSAVVVATSDPPEISWHDLRTGTPPVTAQLPTSATVFAIEFADRRAEVLVDTASGPLRWAGEPATTPSVLIEPDEQVGRSAVLDDGTIVSPLVGTADLAINRDRDTWRITTAVDPSAGLVDAKTIGDGTLAVVARPASDGFDVQDEIVVVEPSTGSVRAAVAVGRELHSGAWTVANSLFVAAGPTIERWSLQGAPLDPLVPAHDSDVDTLLAASDGLIAVHVDGGVSLWDDGTGQEMRLVEPGLALHDASVADGRLLTLVDRSGHVSVRDLSTRSLVADIDRFDVGELTDVAVGRADSVVAASSTTGSVVVLDAGLRERRALSAAEPGTRVDTVTFSPSTGELATGLAERVDVLAFDDTVTLWDDQGPRVAFGGEGEDVGGCAFFYNRIRFTPDGATMATTSHDFSVMVLDPTSGTIVERLPPAESSLFDIAFTPDAELLIATADGASVRVWDTSDYELVTSYQSAMGGYLAIAPLPDGVSMAVAEITGQLAIVDIMTGERRLDFPDLAARANWLSVSADGGLLAAPLDDGRAGLWSTATGRLLTTVGGHSGTISDVAFSSDGNWFATAGSDGTVRTWSIRAV